MSPQAAMMYAALSWAGLTAVLLFAVFGLVRYIMGGTTPRGYWSFCTKLVMLLSMLIGLAALSLGLGPVWVIP